MFLPGYKNFYDRLIEQSETYIRKHCVLKGLFSRLIAEETDANFINDYRYFAFTKSTKILRSIILLLESGNYEDALILCRTVMECYLSQRYLDENFSYSALSNMIRFPIGTNLGMLTHKNGVLRRITDGAEFEYNQISPSMMSIGKDKGYFYDLYSYLCEFSHCNISQLPGYSDSEHNLILDSDFNIKTANLLPLFLFCKLFENVVLLESTHFDTVEEEQKAVRLLKELTEFLYGHLHDLYCSLEKGKVSSNYALRRIARNTMNSFKEQTGRVDKRFVSELEKQYKKTVFSKRNQNLKIPKSEEPLPDIEAYTAPSE